MQIVKVVLVIGMLVAGLVGVGVTNRAARQKEQGEISPAENKLAMGLFLGIVFGIAYGLEVSKLVFDNLALGLPLGKGFGMSIGVAIASGLNKMDGIL
jgi:pantoate kinase